MPWQIVLPGAQPVGEDRLTIDADCTHQAGTRVDDFCVHRAAQIKDSVGDSAS
jgi:hypothetical protein